IMEWIKDNFRITMFEDSEVAIFDKWQLRVSKLKNLGNLGMITKSLIENLNEKEREVLNFKIIDRDQEDEYVWSISTTGKFNSISGSAKTKEQAKDLVERS